MNCRFLLILMLQALVICAMPMEAAIERAGGTMPVEKLASVEEARLALLDEEALGLTYQELLNYLPVAQMDATDPIEMANLGTALWNAMNLKVRDGIEQEVDDRDLYWARLALSTQLRATASVAGLAAFERASRGFEDVYYPDPEALRVLITGFDPFHLDQHLEQSNPSGLAALTLDNSALQTKRGVAWVQAAVFPVRFADFDAGMVEAFIEPLLAENPPDLIVTISMGRDAFDLERFPGRRRSSPVTDNLNVLTGANPDKPLLPLLNGVPLEGPEFVEFTLPAEAMSAVLGDFEVRDNRRVRTLAQGEIEAPSLEALRGEIAVSGSGGGYLSNEISYRTLLADKRIRGAQRLVPMGHLHTPRVQGYDAALEARIVAQIEEILIAAVEALPGR